MNYYAISTLTDDVGYAETSWRIEFKQKWVYPCGHLREGHPIDIRLDANVKNIPINFLYEFRIPFATTEFLFSLSPEIEKYLLLGNVFDENGNKLVKFKTFKERCPRNIIRVRGQRQSTRQFCDICGRFLYFPLPLGKYYIMEQDLNEDEIYLSYFPRLIVSESVLCKIKNFLQDKSQELVAYTLEVLKEPKDGLPITLPANKCDIHNGC